jgi:mannose/fructose/N-acetylgalactosamine-specific phosphotransferase system component IID
MTTQGRTNQRTAKVRVQMLLEKVVVVLLALFFFGIAFRFLHTGESGVFKALIAFLLGIVCLLAFRKAHTK